MKRAAIALGLALALAAGWWAGRAGVGDPGTLRVRVETTPVGGLGPPVEESLPPLAPAPVRNVVLLIADGLGVAQVSAAAVRAFGLEGRFLFERLPVVGLVDIGAADAPAADSANSATAFATGVKTTSGRIGTDRDGRSLPTVLEAARAAGRVAGLVTTSQIWDATPAAFATHVARRRDIDAIVGQLADSGVELLAGGGVDRFTAGGRDRLAEARARGVTVATTPAELAAADRLPLWALFHGKRLGESPKRPTVGELAAKAIELLAAEAARRGTGFFLLVEEEGIDTGAHARDLERTAAALVRFDRAVAAAVRFAAADGATLVVVVGDHATGGLVIDQGSTTERLRVIWGNDRHSGEHVPLYAYGPGPAASAFAGTLDNTEVAHRLAAALGLELGAGARNVP